MAFAVLFTVRGFFREVHLQETPQRMSSFYVLAAAHIVEEFFMLGDDLVADLGIHVQ